MSTNKYEIVMNGVREYGEEYPVMLKTRTIKNFVDPS
jgi:hypothetical protein